MLPTHPTHPRYLYLSLHFFQKIFFSPHGCRYYHKDKELHHHYAIVIWRKNCWRYCNDVKAQGLLVHLLSLCLHLSYCKFICSSMHYKKLFLTVFLFLAKDDFFLVALVVWNTSFLLFCLKKDVKPRLSFVFFPCSIKKRWWARFVAVFKFFFILYYSRIDEPTHCCLHFHFVAKVNEKQIEREQKNVI